MTYSFFFLFTFQLVTGPVWASCSGLNGKDFENCRGSEGKMLREAQAQFRKSQERVEIDLLSAKVGQVDFTKPLSEIKLKLGEKNVERVVVSSEGQDQNTYRLNFGYQRIVTLQWSYLDITHPSFRTKEGLGVGSNYAEFKAKFPQADFKPSPESESVYSEKYKFHLFFKQGFKPKPQDKVIRIWMQNFPDRSHLDGSGYWNTGVGLPVGPHGD